MRLRFVFPLIYLVVGLVYLLALGSKRQGFGIDVFYYASLPTVLLFQFSGIMAFGGMSAMVATFVAGVVQYALVGYGIDRLRSRQDKNT